MVAIPYGIIIYYYGCYILCDATTNLIQLVKRWEKYDEHVQEAKEYQRERKAEAEKDRENKVKQHKNTSIFSRKRQEGKTRYIHIIAANSNCYNYTHRATDRATRRESSSN